MKRMLSSVIAVLLLAALLVLAIQYLHDPGNDEPGLAVADAAAQIARGHYLARAGDCMACHTQRGGQAYAGGRLLPTPFGNLHTPNITPDPDTGIGNWSADDFWRALHNGKAKDGRFLYPAFPYTDYTRITRADSDAMFAYFKSLPAVRQLNRPHALRFPYNQRILLAGWRALYFRPGVYQADPRQSAEWNRGAYLVQGLGHCAACHANRNAAGATAQATDLAGGLIPILGWYAPSLTADAEAGLGGWERRHIAALLKTGVAPRATVFGPMAEVVRHSLQHLSAADIDAMAGYLKSLPQTSTAPEVAAFPVKADELEAMLKLGAKLYDDHCVDCHRADGAGRPPAYPPLAGNRAITMPAAVNAIRIVLNGGYPPSTQGNPRPFGMAPYGPTLSDSEVAALVSYIRQAWGNHAAPVSPLEVGRYRAVPVD